MTYTMYATSAEILFKNTLIPLSADYQIVQTDCIFINSSLRSALF
jgi:hypothetical protein